MNAEELYLRLLQQKLREAEILVTELQIVAASFGKDQYLHLQKAVSNAINWIPDDI